MKLVHKINHSKLIQYSALTAGILAQFSNLRSQVIYTDIDPDILLYEDWNEDEGWKYFDLDNDGTDDIGLNYFLGYSCGYCPFFRDFDLQLFGENQIAVFESGPCTLTDTSGTGGPDCYIDPALVASVFHFGDIISPADQWDDIDDIIQNHFCGIYGDDCTQGAFPGVSNHAEPYFGFRLIDVDTNYCWLRLMWDDYELYATDYACELTPNTGIEIRNKPELVLDYHPDIVLESADQIENESPLMYFSNGQVILTSPGQLLPFRIIIFDTSGKMIFQKDVIENNLIIPFDYPAGLYVVKMRSDAFESEQKIFNMQQF